MSVTVMYRCDCHFVALYLAFLNLQNVKNGLIISKEYFEQG